MDIIYSFFHMMQQGSALEIRGPGPLRYSAHSSPTIGLGELG